VSVLKNIDFRSDTVTHPTSEMLSAAVNAQFGDDVYGDDPTANKLEEIAAEMLGKEAAIFVPSGTFGNQLSILTHTLRGDEVILGRHCHIVEHEAGAASVIAGVQFNYFDDSSAYPTYEDMERLIRQDSIHFPRTGLLCVEEARSNGKVVSLEVLKGIKDMADRRKIPVHMDGARVFNAATALKCDVSDIVQYADSVMFCLSKGLCAPVGSMVVGSKTFIKKARKNRKIMGGAMRQAGIIAAPGIVAMEKMTQRLEEDHANASYLAEKLQSIENIEVIDEFRDINMVFCKINGNFEEFELVDLLKEKDILINPSEAGIWRFVTHYWVGKEAIDKLVEGIAEFFSE
jgi:threonine aldolase